MDTDQAQEEFASFRKRLEFRTGKENEKNDSVKEDEIEAPNDETKPEVSDASASSPESEGEVGYSEAFLIQGDSCFQWTKYQRECLKSHNSYRAEHGAQPLVLDRKVESLIFINI